MENDSPQNILRSFIQAYFEKRDVDEILSCVTDNVGWIGTELNDRANGKEEFRKLLMNQITSFPHAIQVDVGNLDIQYSKETSAFVSFDGVILPNSYVSKKIALRGTFNCEKGEKGWLISNMHLSLPESQMENFLLENTIKDERQKQNALLENVPGGVAMYRLKKDGRIPTDYVSDGLAKICGYDNSEDIMKVMGEDSRKMVLEEDFHLVAEACKASVEKGVPTSVKYRVHGKDGNPVFITLDSIVMKNATLGEDDVAVFYAVQTLVNKEASKKIEEQNALISLLNTVPAGIGIFEVLEDGINQVYMNDAFYRLVDSKREDRTEYLGKNTLGATHPRDIQKLYDVIESIRKGENSIQQDYRVMGGKGKWVWLHLSASVVERKEKAIRVYAAYYACTESKLKELELVQNQNALRLAQKQGEIAIWTYNIDKKTITQPIQTIRDNQMGYPATLEHVPECFIEANRVYAEDIDKFLDTYKQIENGAEKVDLVYRLFNLDKKQFDWLHMFYQRMENNDDGDRMAVGFSIIVNKQQEAVERYHVEQNIREQMYANATIYMEYNLSDGQYEGENNLQDKYRKGRWEKQSLEEYRENMRQQVDEVYLDEITEKMYGGNLLKAFENGETKVSCIYRSKERENQPSQWYRITASMVKRPDTSKIVAFVYVENIEDEKNRQIAIESSLSDGIESVAIIHIQDRLTHLIVGNGVQYAKGQEKVFTYDDDFVRRSSHAAIESERIESEKAALLSTVRKELSTSEIYQYAISTKMGNLPFKRQLFRYRYLDDRRTNIIMSVSDITSVYLEEQEKKHQLETALRELQNASQAKASFYSRMSHDMRTPMNGILGMAELSKDENDPEKLKENIAKIKESGEYLLSLINDTLDLQRIESGKMKIEPTIVSTPALVGNILDMVNVTAKAKGVNLKYSKGNTDLNWFIRIDALHAKQIFINLLSNAIKFTPKGGEVEFIFKLLSRDGMISHNVIYVKDTGIGMSKEFLENGIFKPFSQESNAVSSSYAGSGLGLSIAKSLVELMGGRIEVESELGKGTTFAVYLDFERVSEEEANASMQIVQKQSQDVTAVLKDKHILLVEDQALNAEIAKRLLGKNGCNVTWVQNGKEALDYFSQTEAGDIDVILMDIRMPVMDGLEATRRIRTLDRKDAKTVPIIAMTANAYAEDVKASMEAGMNAHLGKPIQPKVMYETIAYYLK